MDQSKTTIMKKITLLLLTFFSSLCGYSQLALEGFESTTGPDVLPGTTWTLGTGNWAVFDNGIGTGQRWGINSTVSEPPIVYQGTNSAYINRETMNIGDISEDFLASNEQLTVYKSEKSKPVYIVYKCLHCVQSITHLINQPQILYTRHHRICTHGCCHLQ